MNLHKKTNFLLLFLITVSFLWAIAPHRFNPKKHLENIFQQDFSFNSQDKTWASLFLHLCSYDEDAVYSRPDTVFSHTILFHEWSHDYSQWLSFPQEWGGEVCSVLSEVCGANAAKRRKRSQTISNGARVHFTAEPLSPLTALQHPSALHEQHLPGLS